MDDLREYIQDKKKDLPERKAKPNAVGKVAVGYLVSIEELGKLYSVETIRT